MLTNYLFWLSQPLLSLDEYDKWLGYLFAGFLVLALVLWLLNMLVKHPVSKKPLKRLVNLCWVSGLSGLIWFGFRYENTPVFARRFWALLVLAIALVWLIFILKYLAFNFTPEKKEYDSNQLKSKYFPKASRSR
ncbi:MAG: hypothetical protein ACM3KM_03780 [Acidobacteriaceae bacterium]